MRGAAFLSGVSDGAVIDVGGTTSDIGFLKHGFPREANNVVAIGGVRPMFRMPDLLSLGLGGGTEVTAEPLTVGPRSVGYRLTEQALVFGGRQLTVTDIANTTASSSAWASSSACSGLPLSAHGMRCDRPALAKLWKTVDDRDSKQPEGRRVMRRCK